MTAFPTFGGGTGPTAGQWQTLLPLFARRSADITPIVSNTTLANDSVLFAAPSINQVFHVEFGLYYRSSATADYKCGFTFPTGAHLWLTSTNTTGADVLGITQLEDSASGSVFALGGGGVSTTRSVIFSGTLVMGSTSGNFQYQAAQLNLDATNTVTRAGSYLLLTQVA